MKIYKLYLVLLLLISYGAVAQESIGVAAAVNQNTSDLTLEQERKLVEAGYKIIQNHTIETDNIGKAQMLLVDGTAFTIGPNSSVTLDRFIYNPETAELGPMVKAVPSTNNICALPMLSVSMVWFWIIL
jgi:hypothetical protein